MKRFICILLFLCMFPFEAFAQKRTDYKVFHTKKYRQMKRKHGGTMKCETFGKKKIFPSGSKNGNYYRRGKKHKRDNDHDYGKSKCEPKIYKEMVSELKKADRLSDQIGDLRDREKDMLTNRTINYFKRDTTGHLGVSKTIRSDFRKWLRKQRNKLRKNKNERLDERQDKLREERSEHIAEAERLELLHDSLCNPKNLVDPCDELDLYLDENLDKNGFEKYVTALGYARVNEKEPAAYEMITIKEYNKNPDRYPFLSKKATKLNKDMDKHKSEKDYIPKEGLCGGCNKLYEKQKEFFDIGDLDSAERYTSLLLELKCEKIVKPVEDCTQVTTDYKNGIETFLSSKSDLDSRTKSLNMTYQKASDVVDGEGNRCGSCNEIEDKLESLDKNSQGYKDLSGFAKTKDCYVPQEEKTEPTCEEIMTSLDAEIQLAKEYPSIYVLNENSENFKKALDKQCIYCGQQIETEEKVEEKPAGNPTLSCANYKTGKIEVTPNQKFYCSEAVGNKLCNDGEAAWTKNAYSTGGVYGEFVDHGIKMRCFCDPENNRVVNLSCCDMSKEELQKIKDAVTTTPEVIKESVNGNGVKQVSTKKMETVDDLKYVCTDRKYQLAEKWKTFTDKMSKACYVTSTNERFGFVFEEKIATETSNTPTTFSSSQDANPDK